MSDTLPRNPLRAYRAAVVLVASTVLGACASYRPVPLATHGNAVRDLQALRIDSRSMPLPELAAHRFDPSDGLDMTEVAMLAVSNNPDLRLARDDAGVAYAQAFAARLLPDPQVSLSSDFPTTSGADLTSAFAAGLAYELSALVTHAADRKAAAALARKVDLSLLWQEWQVVARARELYVRLVSQERLARVLRAALRLQEARYRAASRAVVAGNLTLDVVSPYLVAQEDTRRQLDDLERQQLQSRHDLGTLLGLAPDVQLALAGPTQAPPLDETAVRTAVRQLAQRRPDLLALQAGYRSQESKLRAAVLAQFPGVSVGLTRARDTSAIYTSGVTVTLNLPIFNRNRGNIAVEEATRRRLRDEYQVRLNQAGAEIDQLLEQLRLLERQRTAATAALDILKENARHAAAAYGRHQMALLSYVDLTSALQAKQVEVIGLEQNLLEQRIALQALLGGELPAAVDDPAQRSTPTKTSAR